MSGVVGAAAALAPKAAFAIRQATSAMKRPIRSATPAKVPTIPAGNA